MPGFQGLLEWWFGADEPLGEKIALDWSQMGVYFQRRKVQEANSG